MRRAYVVGAYLANGGAAMAYHLGRILEFDFGFQAIAVAVGDEHPDEGVRGYDLRMPIVSIDDMERQIAPDDVLIVNAGYSRFLFGWRIPGFKIAYVQGFAQFNLLDRRLDHFVAVSDMVARHLEAVYDLDVRVIPPFIDLADAPRHPAWSERPSNLVLPYRKGLLDVWALSFRRVQEILADRAPEISLAEPIQGPMPQTELWSHIAGARYLLTLSAAEGFGLVPLEAMALGTLVVGYDGFGGRQYMRSGDNCMVAPFAQIERVADLLIDIVRDSPRAEAMVERARVTAAAFTYEAFRRAWIDELSAVLSLAPVATDARG
jgi:hypothetical protein